MSQIRFERFAHIKLQIISNSLQKISRALVRLPTTRRLQVGRVLQGQLSVKANNTKKIRLLHREQARVMHYQRRYHLQEAVKRTLEGLFYLHTRYFRKKEPRYAFEQCGIGSFGVVARGGKTADYSGARDRSVDVVATRCATGSSSRPLLVAMFSVTWLRLRALKRVSLISCAPQLCCRRRCVECVLE